MPRLTTQYGAAPSGRVTASPLPANTLRREKVDEQLVKQPSELVRVLLDIQTNVDDALQRTSPLDGGVILSSEDGTTTGLAFTAGTPRSVQHKLGRKPQFVLVLSAWGNYPQFQRIDQSPEEDALTVKLQFQNTCTVVLWVGP